MIDRNPAVAKLHAHLEGEQHVLFPSNATQAQRLEITNRIHSPLMEYFARPIGVYNMRLETVHVVSEPLPDTFSEIPNYAIKFVSNSCGTCLKIVTTTTSAYMRASTSNSSMVQACNPLLITHTTTISPNVITIHIYGPTRHHSCIGLLRQRGTRSLRPTHLTSSYFCHNG